MNPQYLFMGTADTLLETFGFLADSNKKQQNNPRFLHVFCKNRGLNVNFMY